MLADNYDFDMGKKALDFLRGLQTVQTGHADVHHDDIGAKRLGFLDGILAVHSFPAQGDGRFSGEDRANSPSDQFVIVDH
jgi:hypothetical protein